MTRAYVCRDLGMGLAEWGAIMSCVCGTWLIHVCCWKRATGNLCDSFMCVAWRIHRCGMTYSNMWYDSFRCATWLIHMCDMTHPHMWHDSFICVTWLIHTCAMTRSHMWHDSSIGVAERELLAITARFWVGMRLAACGGWGMRDMTHSYWRHDPFMCVGWLIHMGDLTDSPRDFELECDLLRVEAQVIHV